jgi:hypothetical protein
MALDMQGMSEEKACEGQRREQEGVENKVLASVMGGEKEGGWVGSLSLQ